VTAVSETLRQALANPEVMQTEFAVKDPPVSERSIHLLITWLNFHVMATKIQHFPHDFFDNGAKLAYEALEGMSGKAVPGKVGHP
jgi:hypothetical protein